MVQKLGNFACFFNALTLRVWGKMTLHVYFTSTKYTRFGKVVKQLHTRYTKVFNIATTGWNFLMKLS